MRYVAVLAALLAAGPFAGPAMAQGGELTEHARAIAAFDMACARDDADFAAMSNAFSQAGMIQQSQTLYAADEGYILGMISQTGNAQVRTCAVMLNDGKAELLNAAVAKIAERIWPQGEFEVVYPQGADNPPAYLRVTETQVWTMTVVDKDPKMPVMNMLFYAPGGFE